MIRKRILLSATLICALFGSPAMAVEEPAFKTVLKDGNFEARDYPALVVDEVAVSGDQKKAASKGFRLLAAYIFGGKGEVEAKSEELLAATRTHHLRAIGQVSLAQYTPPWMRWFVRRNEVMIPVEHGP